MALPETLAHDAHDCIAATICGPGMTDTASHFHVFSAAMTQQSCGVGLHIPSTMMYVRDSPGPHQAITETETGRFGDGALRVIKQNPSGDSVLSEGQHNVVPIDRKTESDLTLIHCTLRSRKSLGNLWQKTPHRSGTATPTPRSRSNRKYGANTRFRLRLDL
jgi:hypothetical protein